MTAKKIDSELTGTDEMIATGSVLVATGANKKVMVQLTNAQTGGLAVGYHSYKYDVEAIIGGRRVTLVSGTMTIKEDQTTA